MKSHPKIRNDDSLKVVYINAARNNGLISVVILSGYGEK
jgi:hypothetical protein